MKKRILGILMCLIMVVGQLPMAVLAEETAHNETLKEIRLYSETTSVYVGPLPKFKVTTTTPHAQVEDYGDNTRWFVYKSTYFGTDIAAADGYNYGLRLHVKLDKGYSFDENTKIYFNDEDVTSVGYTGLGLQSYWGGYIYIDLGPARESGSTPEIHTVSFDLQGAGVQTNRLVGHGDTLKKPNNPEYVGHSFEGWYKDLSDTEPFDFNTPITSNITLYAKWSKNETLKEIRLYSETTSVYVGPLPKFKVTTTTPHAQVEDYGDNTRWFVYKSTYFGTDIAAADGYSYGLRLHVKLDKGYSFDENTKIYFNDEDVTSVGYTGLGLQSYWGGYIYIDLGPASERVSYVADFDGNGGGGSMKNILVKIGEKLTLPKNEFTPPEGKEFYRWKVEKAKGGTKLFDEGDKVDIATDVTVKALWKNKLSETCNITFNAGGGSGSMPSLEVLRGSLFTLPESTFTPPEGKSFQCWKVSTEGNYMKAGSQFIIKDDTVITPVWEGTSYYTVTFDYRGHGGIETLEKVVEKNGTVTPPDNPKEKGWIFDGWYNVMSTPFDFNTPINFNMTLMAKWTKDTSDRTVSFDSHGGSPIPSQTVVYGGKVTKPEPPTRPGFTFYKWYVDETYTTFFDFNKIITEDTVIHASWMPVASSTYNVTIAYPITGGSVTASPMSGIAAGDLVTVTATPNAGYELEYIIVKDDATNLVTMETGNTFRMPAANVNVDATFRKKGVVIPTTYDLTTKVVGGHGSVSAGKTNLPKNSVETVVFSPDEGYEIDEVTVNGAVVGVLANVLNVKMDADKIVIVRYRKIPAVPGIVYTVIKSDASWKKGSGKDFEVIVKRSKDDDTCFSHFTTVEIDGNVLVKGKDYEAKSGSTVVTLKAATLRKLAAGSHKISVNFDDGKAESTIMIKKAATNDDPTQGNTQLQPGNPDNPNGNTTVKNQNEEVPKTGDGSNMPLYALLMLTSGTLLFIGNRRRKHAK